MTEVEVGSMAVLGVYRDAGLKAGVGSVISTMKMMSSHVKSTTTEMFRMANQASMLSRIIGLIGVGGFASLLMNAPRAAAALSRIHIELKLIANVIDQYVGPMLMWLAEGVRGFREWFQQASPVVQGVTTVLMGLGAAISFLAPIVLYFRESLGKLWAFLEPVRKVIKTLITRIGTGLWRAITKVATFFGGTLIPRLVTLTSAVIRLAGPAALGALVGILGVMLLDKTGVLKYFADLGSSFRERIKEGEKFADVLMILVGGFALFGSAILAIAGVNTWDKVREDVSTYRANLTRLRANEYHVGGMVASTGMHYLKAGETVSMEGSSSNTLRGGDSKTEIHNHIEKVVLKDGLDITKFVEMLSAEQGRQSAWRGF